MGDKVLVAMSGGIDSSVAAWMLLNEGYNVAGVTMHFGALTEGDGKRSCTSAAIDDAKKFAPVLTFPIMFLITPPGWEMRSLPILSANIRKENA